MKRKLPNRIRYIPGIFSLIIIPFLFIGFARDYLRHHQATSAIPIAWPDLSRIDDYKEMFVAYRNNFPPLRTYTKIRLNTNQRSNQLKFDFAAIEATELAKSKDTVNGIHFVFDEESTYGDFIKAVDICRVSGVRTYMPYENNLWVYNLPSIHEPMTAGSREQYWLNTSDMQKHDQQKDMIPIDRRISMIWDSSWQLITGFSFLIASAIRNAIMQNKKNCFN